jgi:hypothetical protein
MQPLDIYVRVQTVIGSLKNVVDGTRYTRQCIIPIFFEISHSGLYNETLLIDTISDKRR